MSKNYMKYGTSHRVKIKKLDTTHQNCWQQKMSSQKWKLLIQLSRLQQIARKATGIQSNSTQKYV